MTTIKGKDAPLEESISRFKSILNKLNIEVIESGWLNPLANVFSVHLALASCQEIYSNGKGSSKLAALASAYGELFERLGTHIAFSDYFLGLKNAEDDFVHFRDEKWTPIEDDSEDIPTEILNSTLRKFYLDENEVRLEDLIDLQSSSFSRGVCSIPFKSARNGEIVYFPINLLDNLYGSNGMSAGNTEYEALVQGISEIIERYVKSQIIKKGISLPQIPEDILQKYPKSFETYKALQGGGIKAICFDASLGGQFPVVCVVLLNQRNGTCVASFGSHPIFEAALDRTLTELMQGRTFCDLDNFDEPTFDLNRTSDVVNIESHFVDSTGLLPMQMFKDRPDYKFVSWDFSGSTKEQYDALRHMISKLGFELYIRRYDNLGVPVYRAIIPGMSEIYPIDDLVYNNLNAAIDFQESLLSLPSSNEPPQTYADYLDELESEDFENEALVCNAIGIMPDENSSWASLRFGELKCLLALASKKWDEALEYARWTVSYNLENFPLDKLLFYKCLSSVLEALSYDNVDANDYKQAFSSLYGDETYLNVMSHINGTKRFNNLKDSDLNLNGFEAHKELIRIYGIIKGALIEE